MADKRPGRGEKPWAQKSRAEQITTVAIWGLVAALFISLTLTLLLS